MYINKRAMLSNVYDICTVVAHLRLSHAQEQSVRIHHIWSQLFWAKRTQQIRLINRDKFTELWQTSTQNCHGLVLFNELWSACKRRVQTYFAKLKSIAGNIALTSAWTKSYDLSAVYTKITAVAFWFFLFWIFKKIEYIKQNIHFFHPCGCKN